jgi:mannitol/fructose-specific phosphotransferase system IIA component (Ntr-type)
VEEAGLAGLWNNGGLARGNPVVILSFQIQRIFWFRAFVRADGCVVIHEKGPMQTTSMTSLAQFTTPALLLPRLAGDHRESIVSEMAKQLEEAGRISNADAFADAVLAHDALAAAVFDGVAFPLGRGTMVTELSLAVGLMPQPVHWGTPHAPMAHTVVLIAAPIYCETSYLPLVPAFCKFLKDQKALLALRQSTRPEEMLAVLDQVRV